jgi:hypothetical protein
MYPIYDRQQDAYYEDHTIKTADRKSKIAERERNKSEANKKCGEELIT